MAILLFFILTMNLLLLFAIIIYFKEYKNTYPLYLLFLILIFYTPSVYYIMGGSSYRCFNELTFTKYMAFSAFLLFINSIFLILKNSTLIKPFKSDFLLWINNEDRNLFINIYFLSILLLVFGYIIIYFKHFPIIHFLSTGKMLDRPDVTGAIPHFYTMSTIMYFLFPSIYFFKFRKIKSVYYHIIFLLIIFCVLTISGHKGIIAFFGIFLWYYGLKRKINLTFFIIILTLLAAYAITKGVISFQGSTIEYLLTSPFRRFFITQGACMITRFHMLDIGYTFDYSIPIKIQVCDIMYDGVGMGCSAPTYFIGDLIIKFGFLFATSVYIIVLAGIIWLIKNIDILYPENLFIKWNLFCFLFLIGMAEITTSSLLRIFSLVLNVYIVGLLSRYKFKQVVHFLFGSK